jgi:formylglycine-generating enzyme required for sulfatase activity
MWNLRAQRGLVIASALFLLAAWLAAAGVRSALRDAHERRERASRLARGQTPLRIVNAAGAALDLYRAGKTLGEVQPLSLSEGERWLEPGRYFVEAALAGHRLLFPVEVAASGTGPEPDGSWTVTVRRPTAETPPRLDGEGTGFCFVPAGYVVLGERTNPGQAHAAWVPSFYMAVFEVTNGQFRRFLADPGGYDDRDNWSADGWEWRGRGVSRSTALLDPSHADYSRFGRDELPVMLVTWYEASAYGRWLTRARGGGRWQFRMPTEAEWEKAARGPDGFDYGLGMELSEPQAGLYNWRKNPDAPVTLVAPPTARGMGGALESAGAGFRPNRFGIYHASGNAREWTQSVFRPYNREHPYRDDDRNGDETPGQRVTRGGSWYSASAVRLQLAYREEFQPELSSDDLGFRIVAILGPGTGTARTDASSVP